MLCDSSRGGWYRFVGASGSKMPTSPPPAFYCGTHAAGWIDGVEPAFGQGAVQLQVCFNWMDNPCHFQDTAMVTNCGGYFVYNLHAPVWGCSGRYCGTN